MCPPSAWRAPASATERLAAVRLHEGRGSEHFIIDAVASLERRFYDFGGTSSGRQPSDRIAVIAIDDQSVANIGRWPWPRDVQAQLIDKLATAGAKTIVYTTRSDPYSLDVMPFQMLTGALPFRGDSMAELMYEIANGEAPDFARTMIQPAAGAPPAPGYDAAPSVGIGDNARCASTEEAGTAPVRGARPRRDGPGDLEP